MLFRCVANDLAEGRARVRCQKELDGPVGIMIMSPEPGSTSGSHSDCLWSCLSGSDIAEGPRSGALHRRAVLGLEAKTEEMPGF